METPYWQCEPMNHRETPCVYTDSTVRYLRSQDPLRCIRHGCILVPLHPPHAVASAGVKAVRRWVRSPA